MPEFIHSFQRGRMNKDLDERLIPNGEYRDALNLDLANSDGSNVGTLQNIKGNIELRGKIGSSTGWDAQYIDGLNSPRCIGTIRDDRNEKIYWFIAAQGVSAIAEYDQKLDKVIPVLVDTENILNFSTTYLITGINIIDKFLFWTDDQTEPKKINIEKFKAGTKNFLTHTKIPHWNASTNTYSTNINGRPDMVEADIAVIKKSPLSAPNLSTSSSRYGEQVRGTGLSPINCVAIDPRDGISGVPNTPNFTYRPLTSSPNYVTFPTYGEWKYNTDQLATYYNNGDLAGWDGHVVLSFQAPWGVDENNEDVWKVDDIINLTGSWEEGNDEYTYEVSIKITEITSPNSIKGQIQSISPDIQRFESGTYILWEAVLEEGDPLFEYKFPRFAYRWKYIDNEYSCFSPFSEVAFVGNEFEYLSIDGYNVGMTNNIRKLIVKSIDWGTDEVAEVDILYKESTNTTVYVVETLKRKDYPAPATVPAYFQLKSEIISKVVESNQLLRPWDNVPRKAKAQEIVGNRILYGNYLQNYTTEKVDLSVSIQSDLHLSQQTTVGGPNSNPYIRMPYSSLKSLRSYQAGIIFKDEYGRETPVITTKDASAKVLIGQAQNTNKLSITPSGDAPSWATHYKFFVKETANEYYNLALDRFYYAEDGNLWLSFPSSERNKVDIETYLILKKQHGNDTPVTQSNKYKILAIENQAPEFISTFYKSLSFGDAYTVSGFQVNDSTLFFDGPKASDSDKFPEALAGKNYIEITLGASRTLKYQIESGGRTGGLGVTSDTDQYEITLEKALGPEANFLNSLPTGTKVKIRVYSREKEPTEEFEGRFFVKISRDGIFDANIIQPFRQENEIYEIKHEVVPRKAALFAQDYSGGTANEWINSGGGFTYGDAGNAVANDYKIFGQVDGQPNGWGGFGTDEDAWINDNTKNFYRPPQRGHDWFGIIWWGAKTDQKDLLFGTPSKAGRNDQHHRRAIQTITSTNQISTGLPRVGRVDVGRVR